MQFFNHLFQQTLSIETGGANQNSVKNNLPQQLITFVLWRDQQYALCEISQLVADQVRSPAEKHDIELQ